MRRDAKQETRAAKAAAREDDRIVEAPREPRTPFVRRLGGSFGAGGVRTILSLLAGLIGAFALLCSVALAVGALLVALGADDSSWYDALARTCDLLVGPLRGAFSFGGPTADVKESLVAWGAGSIGYLVISVAAQSVLRSTAKD
jgi:hypothetical protein